MHKKNYVYTKTNLDRTRKKYELAKNGLINIHWLQVGYVKEVQQDELGYRIWQHDDNKFYGYKNSLVCTKGYDSIEQLMKHHADFAKFA